MSKFEKVLRRVLSGEADNNIEFEDLVWLLRRLGFTLRVRGSHHIFTRSDLEIPINLQPSGHHAAPYKVKQTREKLQTLEIEDE